MARIQGMVQVSGTTYRIETIARQHSVVRIRDDRRVGLFSSSPRLRVLESEIAHDELVSVARTAALAGFLPWGAGRQAPAQRLARTRRRSVGGICRLLLLLWPAI